MMENEQRPSYVAYDYKEIAAKGERASLLTDCYRSLGWETEKESATGRIILRRSRKIMNKTELTRLQRNMEACVAEIDALQKSKTSKATMNALMIGLIGTAFMAGSVFAVTAAQPKIFLCILLAIPGFALWALAPIQYPQMIAKRTETINELIEQKYDEIYEICEKGSGLL